MTLASINHSKLPNVYFDESIEFSFPLNHVEKLFICNLTLFSITSSIINLISKFISLVSKSLNPFSWSNKSFLCYKILIKKLFLFETSLIGRPKILVNQFGQPVWSTKLVDQGFYPVNQPYVNTNL